MPTGLGGAVPLSGVTEAPGASASFQHPPAGARSRAFCRSGSDEQWQAGARNAKPWRSIAAWPPASAPATWPDGHRALPTRRDPLPESTIQTRATLLVWRSDPSRPLSLRAENPVAVLFFRTKGRRAITNKRTRPSVTLNPATLRVSPQPSPFHIVAAGPEDDAGGRRGLRAGARTFRATPRELPVKVICLAADTSTNASWPFEMSRE